MEQLEFAIALFAKEASRSPMSFLLTIADEMNDRLNERYEETEKAQREY